MKRLLAVSVLFVDLFVSGPLAFPDDFLPFMGASGTHFTNAENPNFRFVGLNLDPWRFLVQKGEVYTRDDFDSWLVAAKSACGATVVRVHMNGGAFEPTPGVYSEEAFKQLDSLIAAARKNGMYVIIALRDYLWSPWPKNAYDPYWYLGGGTAAKPNKDAILANSKAKAFFKDYIKFVLNRANSLDGVVYKDDPTIMAWELINEPNFQPDAMRFWLKDMGKTVRSIDGRHLIAVGIGGVENAWWRSGSANWAALKVKEIDFLDLHYYANVALYDPVDGKNVAEIRDRIKAGLSLGKPVVFGEFGCSNAKTDIAIGNLYAAILGSVFKLGGSGGMPYSWGPPGPNGWGGRGSYCLYTDRTAVCSELLDISGALGEK